MMDVTAAGMHTLKRFKRRGRRRRRAEKTDDQTSPNSVAFNETFMIFGTSRYKLSFTCVYVKQDSNSNDDDDDDSAGCYWVKMRSPIVSTLKRERPGLLDYLERKPH